MALAQWRPLILASAVTAALAGAVIVQTCTGGGGGNPIADPMATPTAAPTATPTTPPLPEEPVTAIQNPLVLRVFEPGELVAVTNTVGFLSAETGVLETWSAEGNLPIAASRDGWLLQTAASAGGAAILVERATGAAYRLAPGITPLIDSAHAGLVIVGISTGGQVDTAILDLRNGTFRPLGVGAPAGGTFRAHAAEDGRRALLHAGNTIAIVDMVANTAIAIGTTFDPERFGILLLPGGLGFRIVSSGEPGEARWYGWDGEEVSGTPPGRPSQNGRYFAEDVSLGTIKGEAQGIGPYAALSYVIVHDRSSGDDILWLLGASLVQGREPWNAGGDAMLVQVPEGYRLVNLEGSVVAAFEAGVEPFPSPVINGLYGTQLGAIINVSRNSRVEPNYPEPAALVSDSRWSDRPGELIVRLFWPTGRESSPPVQALPFEARTPPFNDAPRLMVAGTGCAPVHDAPSSSAMQLGCAEPGRAAALSEIPDPLYSPGVDLERRAVIGVELVDGTVWLHVAFEDGPQGWVEASRLGWAN